jgi:hypothetical protein
MTIRAAQRHGGYFKVSSSEDEELSSLSSDEDKRRGNAEDLAHDPNNVVAENVIQEDDCMYDSCHGISDEDDDLLQAGQDAKEQEEDDVADAEAKDLGCVSLQFQADPHVSEEEQQDDLSDVSNTDGRDYKSHKEFWDDNYAAFFTSVSSQGDNEDDDLSLLPDRRDLLAYGDVSEEVYQFLKDIYDSKLTQRSTTEILKSLNKMLVGIGQRSTSITGWYKLNTLMQSSVPASRQTALDIIQARQTRATALMTDQY